MTAHAQSPSWFVSGVRGSGKSSLVSALTQAHCVRGRTAYLLDPMAEYGNLPRTWRFRPPVDAYGVDDGPLYGYLQAVALHAWHGHGPRMLVADECNLAVRKGQQGPPAVNLIAHHGRHRDTGLILVTRQPAECPRSWTSQSVHRAVFHMSEPTNLAYCKRIGLEPEHVQALPRGAFFHFEPGHGWHRHDDFVSAGGRLMSCMLTE